MKRVHFLGIGGSGASAAAAIAQAQGFEVTGCDLEPYNEFTLHIRCVKLKGHSASHLGSGKVDLLAVTPAIFSLDPQNPELMEAKKLGIPVLTWQQFVGEYLTKGKFVITVCGTHGKTTTTAMIAQLLEDAGKDPTVLLGAIHPKWKANYRVGKGKYFIIEADEFNDNFLHFKPDINVVTNIEMDHPEYFADFEAVKESFKKFLLQTKETIVANLKDPAVAEIMKDLIKETNVTCFDHSNSHYNLKLQIPGGFNQLNASAAFQVGLLLNIAPAVIRKSLENYTGVGRRFEFIGEYHPLTPLRVRASESRTSEPRAFGRSGQLGAKVYSDFGHHPTEIKVTMEAVREKFPESRILLIYQPHMFSRTKALFDDFVKVFKEVPVDKTFIMDIYPSREVDEGLVTSKQLVQAIMEPKIRHGEKMVPNAVYIGSTDQALEKLVPEIKAGDIVFFMSAGDTNKLAKELVKD